MDPGELQLCISTTEKLMKHRFGFLFTDPVDPVNDEALDYYEIIKNPMDFSKIMNKLNSNSYNNFLAWDSDIKLIFKNSLEYNGKESLLGSVTQQLEKVYNKYSRPLKIKTTNGFLDRASELLIRIDTVMQNSPSVIEKNFRNKKFNAPFKEDDLLDFAHAASQLSSKSDLLRMHQIVALFGGQAINKKSECLVDLSTLPSIAVEVLIKFVKDRFRELKLNYPK